LKKDSGDTLKLLIKATISCGFGSDFDRKTLSSSINFCLGISKVLQNKKRKIIEDLIKVIKLNPTERIQPFCDLEIIIAISLANIKAFVARLYPLKVVFFFGTKIDRKSPN
jgi:hypothetical protein